MDGPGYTAPVKHEVLIAGSSPEQVDHDLEPVELEESDCTSNDDSSSGSSSDVEDEQLASVRPRLGPSAPSKFAGLELFRHKRLGTLHKNSVDDLTKLACGRFKHSGFEPLRFEPQFECSRCSQCFGKVPNLVIDGSDPHA